MLYLQYGLLPTVNFPLSKKNEWRSKIPIKITRVALVKYLWVETTFPKSHLCALWVLAYSNRTGHWQFFSGIGGFCPVWCGDPGQQTVAFPIYSLVFTNLLSDLHLTIMDAVFHLLCVLISHFRNSANSWYILVIKPVQSNVQSPFDSGSSVLWKYVSFNQQLQLLKARWYLGIVNKTL